MRRPWPTGGCHTINKQTNVASLSHTADLIEIDVSFLQNQTLGYLTPFRWWRKGWWWCEEKLRKPSNLSQFYSEIS
jgi:hypothetical protein